MKILQINTVYSAGSTGKIAKEIHDICNEKGWKCITAYRYLEDKTNVQKDTLTVSSWLDCHIHNRLVMHTKLQGCFSRIKTIKFLRKVKKYSPDIIHLHNLHGNYINLPLLFKFIKKNDIKVVWTLHDCWAFTGQCPHFVLAKCEKWKTECAKCPQYKTLGDPVKKMFRLKKKMLTGLQYLTLVTPSKWLHDLVNESFLKEYESKIITHGIDLEIFKETSGNFRDKYDIPSCKKIILGVAFGWGYRKGLDVFIELSKRLDKEKYQIVLVGTNEETDKCLPNNIISIHRTTNQKELAEIYTAAALFVNPTREEMFGLVNVEANACGTPVLTFNTGGSPECIDNNSGSIVPCGDIDALEKEILRICDNNPYTRENCRKRAERFEKRERFEEYIKLYEQINS